MRIREGCILTATNSSDERVKSLIGCKGALHVVMKTRSATMQPTAMVMLPVQRMRCLP